MSEVLRDTGPLQDAHALPGGILRPAQHERKSGLNSAGAEVLLSATNLVKRFGGLAAVNDVSVDLLRNHIHAVIGPNGAGKSTLTNLLSGDLPLTSGSVALCGKDVTGWTPEKISDRKSVV